MADYWKSQPKKFCTYCKCWIADNKPSIEFHERGKNHKENVTKKISEIKQKSVAKAKADEKKAKEFAAMEEAALKAYEEDLKRLEGEQPAPLAPIVLSIEERRTRDDQKKMDIEAVEKHHAKRQWTKSVSPEGYPYFYNLLTRESQWEEPEGFRENTDKNEKESKSAWVEGVSEEGYTYYYNSETGESRWVKPEDSDPNLLPDDKKDSTDAIDVSTAAEQTAANPEVSTVSSSEMEGVSEEGYMYCYNSKTRRSRWDKPEDSDPNLLPDDKKDSTDAVDVSTADDPEDANPDVSTDSSSETSPPSEDTTQTLAIPQTPKINYRPKKESKSESDEGSDPETKQEEAVEKKNHAPKPDAPRPSKTNPYGAWETVQEEEDPYDNVDLELPNVEYDDPAVSVPDVAQEPKVKFKEKTITSLGDAATGASVFKRRKLENVKARNIRQRLNDQ
ncbi:WW domain-binding protein 4 isoform X2 [Dendrobates tinctorius]